MLDFKVMWNMVSLSEVLAGTTLLSFSGLRESQGEKQVWTIFFPNFYYEKFLNTEKS